MQNYSATAAMPPERSEPGAQDPVASHYLTFVSGQRLHRIKLLKNSCSKEEKLTKLYKALRKTVIRKEKQHFFFVLKFLRSLTT